MDVICSNEERASWHACNSSASVGGVWFSSVCKYATEPLQQVPSIWLKQPGWIDRGGLFALNVNSNRISPLGIWEVQCIHVIPFRLLLATADIPTEWMVEPGFSSFLRLGWGSSGTGSWFSSSKDWAMAKASWRAAWSTRSALSNSRLESSSSSREKNLQDLPEDGGQRPLELKIRPLHRQLAVASGRRRGTVQEKAMPWLTIKQNLEKSQGFQTFYSNSEP